MANMEFTAERDQLVSSLQQVERVAERRTTIPILCNVHIGLSNGRALLSATDQEIGICVPCEVASGNGDGALTVSASRLLAIAKQLPEGQVSIRQLDNDWVEVKAHNSKFKIVGLPAHDFPNMPQAPKRATWFSVPVATLSEMIGKTQFAISTDSSRPALCGLLLEILDDGCGLRLSATDGHRLATIEREAENLGKGKVLIPVKGVQEIARLLATGNDPVELAIDTNLLYVRRNGTELSIRLLNAEFPDISQVIPKEHSRLVVGSAEAIVSALKRMRTVADGGVKLDINKTKVILSVVNPDTGEATDEVEVDSTGNPIMAGFNIQYLLDALEAAAGGNVTLCLQDDVSPMLIRFESDPKYLSVIMPMRL